jgi:hypothetical protein
MLTRNPEGQEELIIFSFGKRQFVNCLKFNLGLIHNKYVTKKEKKYWVFSFLQKIKTHYQIFAKN